MKRALLISLSLNTALLFLTMRQSHPLGIPSRIPRLEIANSVTRSLRMAPAPATRGVSDAVTPWSRIDSRDPAKFIANLRTLGCPEATIRDIVMLRVSRKYRNELLQREAEAARSWDYTKSRTDWRERLEQQQELRDEMQTELERLLGQNWTSLAISTLGWSFPPSDTFSFVSEHKRQQLRELEREYNRLKANLERQFSQWLTPDNTPLMQLAKDHQADLARILSPQEVKEYFYRFSPAAKYVLDGLAAAQNESEFRTMVDVAQEFELWNQPALSFRQRYGLPPEPGSDNDNSAEALAANYAARKAAFDTRLKEVLGADRIAQRQREEEARAEENRKRESAAELEREREQIAGIAVSVGVAAEDANRFFDRLKELEPELRPKFEQLEKSLKGTEDEKGEAMKAAMKTELERIATEFMGDKAHAFVEKMDK